MMIFFAMAMFALGLTLLLALCQAAAMRCPKCGGYHDNDCDAI